MKKSRLIIIILITIVLISGIVILTLLKKVEKFKTIKIVDSYGNEIKNYNENTMPFTIERNNEQDKIKVNGKQYTTGTRYYKPGKYEIEVIKGFNIERSTVNIEEIEKSRYNIYMTTETLQTLFANLEMANNSQDKGYIWTSRTATVNIDKIKETLPNIQISEYNDITDENEFINKVIPEVKEYIKIVLQKDSNAYFTLYAEEFRFYLDLELFGKIGLDDSRYETIYYTTGTLGYVQQYEITEENKYERFMTEKQAYMEIVEKMKNNTLEYKEHPGSYLVDDSSILFQLKYNYDYFLISTLRENIKYVLQYPEMIKFKDEKIAKEMENANFIKITAQEEYNKLDEEEKQIFYSNINLNKEELDSKYFEKEDGQYLIITGTVPIYEKKTKDEFEEIIKKICQDYQDEYIILYKPHPRAIPTDEQVDFFNSLNIKVLPGAMPMEVISFIYPNLKIGGFGSSLYMSADKGKTLFFFVQNKNELVEPLNKLYDDLFSDAKFYY